METLLKVLAAINGVLWHDVVLFTILAVGVLFTVWSRFCQAHAFTHGIDVVRGKYDKPEDKGAISHFEALSAALSATVGLGNIGGVAVAIALGGPGAVFWMWVVGAVGMALKTTEVTLGNMFRNVDDPDNPRGGAMWVAKLGFEQRFPKYAKVGAVLGGIFCVTLLISTVTGGNMFQAWNVGVTTSTYFGVPPMVTGVVLAVMVALVIIGGIKRIGSVAGKLVPVMCGLYLTAGLLVIAMNVTAVPEALMLIFKSAFSPVEAQGAFLGGTAGYAFLWGMKRALFSNEAGQGSAPIAHAAAKSDEPVREGVVAGMEPFIDTIIVCTVTALVILVTGAWNRGPEAHLGEVPELVLKSETAIDGGTARVFTVEEPLELPRNEFDPGWPQGPDRVFMVVHAEGDENTGTDLRPLYAAVEQKDGKYVAKFNDLVIKNPAITPKLEDKGIYTNYLGAALTMHAFDRVFPGLGGWLVTIAAWLFAVSTMISWSYYGEQGIVYLLGVRAVFPYKIIYCVLAVVACSGFITTDEALDNLTGFGTGVMLFANIPIMLIFGGVAMRAYRDYMTRVKRGEFEVTKR